MAAHKPDPLVRWALSRSRRLEDPRFAAHGAAAGAALYERFCALRRERGTGGAGGALRVSAFYDTASYECRDEQSSGSGALRLIFNSYCRLLAATRNNTGLSLRHGMTYDVIAVANKTMSWQELLQFARDYALVPHVLSLEALHFCWSRQRAMRQHDPRPSELDYLSFVQVLVRAALIGLVSAGAPAQRVRLLAQALQLERTHLHRQLLAQLAQQRTKTGASALVLDRRCWFSAQQSEQQQLQQDADWRRERLRVVGSASIARPRHLKEPLAPPPQPPPALARSASAPEQLARAAAAEQAQAPPLRLVPSDPCEQQQQQLHQQQPQEPHEPAACSMSETAAQRAARQPWWDSERLFSPALLDLLAPFERDGGRQQWLLFPHSDAIDMGVLVAGTEHAFKLTVRNGSSKSVLLSMELSPSLARVGATLEYEPRPTPMGMARVAVMRVLPTTPVELLGELRIAATDVGHRPVELRVLAVYINVVARDSAGLDETDPVFLASSGEQEEQAEEEQAVTKQAETEQAETERAETEQAQTGQAEARQAASPLRAGQRLPGLAPASPLRRLGSGSPSALVAPTPDQRRPLPVSLAPPERRHLSLATKRAALELSARQDATRSRSSYNPVAGRWS